MIVIRRMVDRQRAYTGIFLPGEAARIFPTSDYEHARILQIYKQDRPHEGIINDFIDLDASPLPPTAQPAAAPPKESQSSTGAKKRKSSVAKPRRGRT